MPKWKKSMICQSHSKGVYGAEIQNIRCCMQIASTCSRQINKLHMHVFKMIFLNASIISSLYKGKNDLDFQCLDIGSQVA